MIEICIVGILGCSLALVIVGVIMDKKRLDKLNNLDQKFSSLQYWVEQLDKQISELRRHEKK